MGMTHHLHVMYNIYFSVGLLALFRKLVECGKVTLSLRSKKSMGGKISKCKNPVQGWLVQLCLNPPP